MFDNIQECILNESDLIWVLISLSFGYVLGVLIVFILIEPERKANIKKIKSLRLEFESSTKEVSEKMDLFEKSINYKFKTFEKLLNSQTQVEENRISKTESVTRKEKKEIEVIPKETAFYFSVPTYQGSFFQEQAKREFTDGENYYKIVVDDKNPSMGSLHYISNNRDKKALNRMDSFLIPVCFIENTEYAPSANSINCITPGKVSLSGNQWAIHQNNRVVLRLA